MNNNRKIIVIASLFLIVIIIAGVLYQLAMHKNIANTDKGYSMLDGTAIDFQLYNAYEVNTNRLKEYFDIGKDEPFVYCRQVYNLNVWKQLREFHETAFIFPDFSFEENTYQDKNIIISFGHEILEITKIKNAYPKMKNNVDTTIKVAVTYAEEYHEGMMYIYLMDKIYFHLGSGSEFYIMEGKEKKIAPYVPEGFVLRKQSTQE